MGRGINFPQTAVAVMLGGVVERAHIIYCVWLIASVVLFACLSPRTALLVVYWAGWGLLPTAAFPLPDTVKPLALDLMASLPGEFFLTKATVLGISALTGVLLFDLRRVLAWRPTWWDAPLGVWCTVPLASAFASDAGWQVGALGTAYLALAWGTPYVLGRIYFGDAGGRRALAVAIILAGLLYVPLCLVEGVMGPGIATLVFGYHPYQYAGAQRYIGYRPVGFLEDGNQLGMWTAGAALVAFWLWREGALPKWRRVPAGAVVTVLVAAAVAGQSVGSVLLAVAGAATLEVTRRVKSRALAGVLLVMVVGFLVIRATNVLPLGPLAKNSHFGQLVARELSASGRGSAGWRLKMEEQHIATALERPILGWGQWDWWRGGEGRPWGLWLLVFGMYGFVGLASVYALVLLSSIRAMRALPLTQWRTNAAAIALGSLLVMTALDSLLNSGVILPVLLAAGGLGTERPIGKSSALPKIGNPASVQSPSTL